MPGPGRLAVEQQRSCLGKKPVRGILGVDAALDGVAALRQLVLRPRQRLAVRDGELRANQIDAGHGLRDRMLDLQPRVHLEEKEARVARPRLRRGTQSCRRCDSRPRARPRRPPRPCAGAARGVTAGDGLSSMTFWWRRWTEHSRSNRWTTLPCASAKI